MSTKTTNISAMLAITTRGYVWHETAVAAGPYNPIYYREKLSVSNVRNRIVKDFLGDKYGHKELLYMLDDDTIPSHPDWPSIMDACPYDVVGVPTPMAKLPDLPVVLNVFREGEKGNLITQQLPESGHTEVGVVGTGCILIRRHVLEHPDMKRPFL